MNEIILVAAVIPSAILSIYFFVPLLRKLVGKPGKTGLGVRFWTTIYWGPAIIPHAMILKYLYESSTDSYLLITGYVILSSIILGFYFRWSVDRIWDKHSMTSSTQ